MDDASPALLAWQIILTRTHCPGQKGPCPPTDRSHQIRPNDLPGSNTGIKSFLDSFLDRVCRAQMRRLARLALGTQALLENLLASTQLAVDGRELREGDKIEVERIRQVSLRPRPICEPSHAYEPSPACEPGTQRVNRARQARLPRLEGLALQ